MGQYGMCQGISMLNKNFPHIRIFEKTVSWVCR